MVLFDLLIWLLAIAVAITIHEFAHAWMADRLGDPTARLDDRLSLNPLKHYDPVGTTLLIATSLASTFGVPIIPFGWAKPVPFDPYNLQDPKRDTLFIALAGPVSNLILATLVSLVFRFGLTEMPLITPIALSFITINVSLAIFNLIPVYPLDGGKILYGLLPGDIAEDFREFMERYSLLVMFLLIVPFGGTSLVSLIVTPVTMFLLQLLLP